MKSPTAFTDKTLYSKSAPGLKEGAQIKVEPDLESPFANFTNFDID